MSKSPSQRHQAPIKPQNRTLTPRERKFLKVWSKTGNKTEAAVAAYNTQRPAAGSMGYEVSQRIKRKFPELMDKVGITEDMLAETLFEALSAETGFYSKAAQDIVYVKDWQARLKAVDMGLKLRSLYPKEQSEVDHNYNFTITRGDAPLSIDATRPENPTA